MKRTNLSKYPSVVCQTCGDIGSDGHQFQISTWYQGKCDICGMKTVVTESRDFFHCGNKTTTELRKMIRNVCKRPKKT